ncbi:MAG: nucleoside recognition domain-containing protein, partial [Bacteroidales bacterium]|nr:nucleoside recognition domain-containing protein [Bacteroidales bacterium]
MKCKFRLPNGVTCLLVILVIFGYLSAVMGLSNMLNTMMHTAHDLLLNTVFYIMAICVLTGALAKIFTDFGVVDLLQKALMPIMKPLFNLPGVASLGAVMTFLSDNPAIITLAQDKKFAKYFKKYQLISLTNFGTAFGMGLIVIVFMIGQGYFLAPVVGLLGAVIGCIVSTRLMQYFICKEYPSFKEQDAVVESHAINENQAETDNGQKAPETGFVKVLNALLDGGKSGVEIGLAIIPGVLVISTFVMMITFGGSTVTDASGNEAVVFTGAAYEGTRLLPWLASKIDFVFKWLF